MDKIIPITKSFLPPIEEYMAQVRLANDNEWRITIGELVKEMNAKLTSFLSLLRSFIFCIKINYLINEQRVGVCQIKALLQKK
jgi:hypothetical protein